MSRTKTFFSYFGLFFKPEMRKPHDLNPKEYEADDRQLLELHKTYIKNLEKDEDERLNSIENKTSQIISQTGLIFSLLSLFVPFIIGKVLDFNIYLKFAFIAVLSLAYLFYILTIHNALKNFNVRKFNYVKGSPTTIINQQKKKIEKFLRMEIRDALFGLNNNIAVNNIKATNLITAHNSFRIGNIFTSILVIFLCSSLLFINSTPAEIKISEPVEIKNIKDLIQNKNENYSKENSKKSLIKKDSVKSTTGNKELS